MVMYSTNFTTSLLDVGLDSKLTSKMMAGYVLGFQARGSSLIQPQAIIEIKAGTELSRVPNWLQYSRPIIAGQCICTSAVDCLSTKLSNGLHGIWVCRE